MLTRVDGKLRTGVIAAVGALLLIALTVAAGLAVLSFSTYLLRERQLAHEEDFIVDEVLFGIARYNLTISVYNVNPMDSMKVSTVYISNTTGITAHAAITISPPIEIRPQERAWVNGTWGIRYHWIRGQLYLIKVASARGNVHESYWRSY